MQSAAQSAVRAVLRVGGKNHLCFGFASMLTDSLPFHSYPKVQMTIKKDEPLIDEGDNDVEDDKYSVAVIDNPIYDVDPDDRPGDRVVSYMRKGQESDDEEEQVKVNFIGITVHV